jgi:hypothetical protein
LINTPNKRNYLALFKETQKNRTMILSDEELAKHYAEMEEYAKKEAFAFFEFKSTYQRIEVINFRHKHHALSASKMPTWIGAKDEVIWEAYKKGEQLKRHYEI